MNYMSRFKSINVLMGVIMVFAFTIGTVATASAQNQGSAQHLAFKGQHLVLWDFFPYTPFNGPERVASTKIAEKWAKSTGATVTETQPAAGVNPAFIADPKKAADVLMAPDDEVGSWYGSHLISKTHINSSLYTPTAVSACTLAGHTWCYPWALESIMLYYNKADISAKKMASLKTWSELAKWANAFHKSTGKWGFGDQISETYKANPFLTSFGGGDIYHSSKGYNGKKIIVGSAATVKGLDAFKNFFNATGSGAVQNYLTKGSYDSDLANGSAAIVLTGPWDDAKYRGTINYGVAPLPGNKVGGKIVYGKTFLGVQTLAVNKFSKHQAAAQSLAAYMSTHMELPLYKASGRIPATKAALKKVSNVPELKQYAKQFLHSEPLPNVPQMSFVWNCTADAIELTFKGAGSASSNLKVAQAKIEGYIKAGSGSCAPPS
jgi:maltose-binding protein MalE